MFPLILLVGLITGTMIGTVGVGGVLLSPFLFYGLGIDLHTATAMSSWSFLFTGIVGTVTYWKKGSISFDIVKWLSVGIIPGAILGARANVALSSDWLIFILALIILASGINMLISRPASQGHTSTTGNRTLILLGLVTGFGSALTGTGGPVLLVPILMFIQFPTLVAIAASQVVQIPIAASASIGFGLFGQTDLLLGSALGIIQSIGVVFGARIAHSLKPDQLRHFVALALIGAAILIITQLIIR